jgi:hypothetical protein
MKTAFVTLVLGSLACRAPDPRKELAVRDVETYWVVDAPVGEKRYLAPAVRFSLQNKGDKAHRSIEVLAKFLREGESEQWGGDWRRVAPAGKPLEPGQSTVVVMRSDGRYYSEGTPESMFQHELFKDARVEVFLRVGSSDWTRFADQPVERRIGSRAAQADAP